MRHPRRQVIFVVRLSRWMAEAYQLGSALEALTGADLAYQQR